MSRMNRCDFLLGWNERQLLLHSILLKQLIRLKNDWRPRKNKRKFDGALLAWRSGLDFGSDDEGSFDDRQKATAAVAIGKRQASVRAAGWSWSRDEALFSALGRPLARTRVCPTLKPSGEDTLAHHVTTNNTGSESGSRVLGRVLPGELPSNTFTVFCRGASHSTSYIVALRIVIAGPPWNLQCQTSLKLPKAFYESIILIVAKNHGG